jgi:cytidylate kinase
MHRDIKIAVSGKSGCGNSTSSKILADKLGFEFINYTFKNLAAEKGMRFEELQRLAQLDAYWDRYLDDRQVQKARDAGSCVLGSRLAVWMLNDADLRVYLTAPVGVRAARIKKREGGNFEDVLRKTIERDKNDRDRYLRLYGIDNDKYNFVDMVVDTENLDPHAVAELILQTVYERFGDVSLMKGR